MVDHEILEILETQYSECWNDIRDHRTRMWQLAASGIALTVASAGVVSQVHVDLEQGAFAAITAFLVLMFYVQLRKERFFEKVRTTTLECIQEKLKEAGGVDISWKTKKIIEDIEQKRLKYEPSFSWFDRFLEKLTRSKKDSPVPWFEKQSAYRWLDNMMLILVGGLVIAAILLSVV